MNNYEEGISILKKEGLNVKSVRQFRGHDGPGVNANVYLGRQKRVEVDDDGWGGGLAINYTDDRLHKDEDGNWYRDPKDQESLKAYKATLERIIALLPKYSWEEQGISGYDDDHDLQTWDEEGVYNALIDDYLMRKEFKKAMKKCVSICPENKIHIWKVKAEDYSDHDWGKHAPGHKFLNTYDDEEQAFLLWRRFA